MVCLSSWTSCINCSQKGHIFSRIFVIQIVPKWTHLRKKEKFFSFTVSWQVHPQVHSCFLTLNPLVFCRQFFFLGLIFASKPYYIGLVRRLRGPWAICRARKNDARHFRPMSSPRSDSSQLSISALRRHPEWLPPPPPPHPPPPPPFPPPSHSTL